MVKMFDRLLLFVYSTVIGATLLVLLCMTFGFIHYDHAVNYLRNMYYESVVAYPIITISIIFLLISVRMFYLSIRKREGHFPSIDRRTELGEVKISMDTIQSLTLKAGNRIQGLSEIKTRIRAGEQGLVIDLRAAVSDDIAIPQLTDELQQTVKAYVEELSGIQVSAVSVYITNVVSKASPPLFKSRVE
jgi:uncharacterized alkaline shock family protein YloU